MKPSSAASAWRRSPAPKRAGTVNRSNFPAGTSSAACPSVVRALCDAPICGRARHRATSGRTDRCSRSWTPSGQTERGSSAPRIPSSVWFRQRIVCIRPRIATQVGPAYSAVHCTHSFAAETVLHGLLVQISSCLVKGCKCRCVASAPFRIICTGVLRGASTSAVRVLDQNPTATEKVPRVRQRRGKVRVQRRWDKATLMLSCRAVPFVMCSFRVLVATCPFRGLGGSSSVRRGRFVPPRLVAALGLRFRLEPGSQPSEPEPGAAPTDGLWSTRRPGWRRAEVADGARTRAGRRAADAKGVHGGQTVPGATPLSWL